MQRTIDVTGALFATDNVLQCFVTPDTFGCTRAIARFLTRKTVDYMRTENIRQIVLDTETTGMNQTGAHYEGHRIIEIGAVEVVNRRLTGNNFHLYLQPDRLVEPDAFNVHGIADEFLLDKPRFGQVVDELLAYIEGAELVIHNASFDVGFLDYELRLAERSAIKIQEICKVTDTLALARRLFPGKRNNLDALCTRYEIDNSKRVLHGALLDAEILAHVYLAMTGGQTALTFDRAEASSRHAVDDIVSAAQPPNKKRRVLTANAQETAQHQSQLEKIRQKAGQCLWHQD